MKPSPASDNVVVEAALADWRRKATNAFMAATAVACLPVLLLGLAGQGPSMGHLMWAVVMLAYATVVAGALLRRVNHEARMWAVLSTGYLLALAGSMEVPYGPFMRSLPIPLAIMALVFIGARAGRIATAISAVILIFAPFLRVVPWIDQFLASDFVPETAPPLLTITQGLALTAMMLPLVILMERFHLFLIQSLAAERRAAAELEQEAFERTAAYRKLEQEMNERRRLQREITRIADEERRHLGQDMHDGVCQLLTGALLRCQALERRAGRSNTPDSAEIDALACLLEDTINEAYAVARGLNPLDPDPGALVPALRALAKRARASGTVNCEFVATGDVRVDDPASAHHLYRIVQEALSNAARHAQASRIVVELCGREDALVLHIEDDGVGIPDDPAVSEMGLPINPGNGGMGLRTMLHRAQAMEGTLTVERPPSGGTRITCQVPRWGRTRPAAGPCETEATDREANNEP